MAFWNFTIDELISYIKNSFPFSRITVSGSAGIGTTSPVLKLDVKSSDNIQINAQGSNGSFGGYQISNLSVPTADIFCNFSNNYLVINSMNAGGAQAYVILRPRTSAGTDTDALIAQGDGKVGIGTIPSYLLHVFTDSAGKPGAGGLWTVVSDERIKKDIEAADLDRCCEIVKSVPLKRFGWAEGVFTEAQVRDRACLGWISQDVQKIFPKSVSVVPFAVKVPDVTGDKYHEEIIEDCLDLNGGQMMMAMYGAMQQLIARIEILEKKLLEKTP